MKKHLKILAIAALAFVRCGHQDLHNPSSSHSPVSHEPHWSYFGSTGPAKWADLKPEFAACRDGRQQSPIDIAKFNTQKLEPMTFDYKPTYFKVVDNGHTIQVNYPEGNSVNIRGEKFDLVQMHFHSMSEHTLNHKTYPMELHFVHKNQNGQLAVVGVWMELGKNNPFIDTLWSQVPKEKNMEMSVAGVKLNPADFLPNDHKYYHYTGSLTTPPCSEGVNWNVIKSPIKISMKQIDQFRKIYSVNNRPTQPAFARIPATGL